MKDPGHPPTLVRKPEQIESMYELPRRIDAPEYADDPHPDQQQPQVAPALQYPQYVHTSEKEHQKARDLAPRLHGGSTASTAAIIIGSQIHRNSTSSRRNRSSPIASRGLDARHQNPSPQSTSNGTLYRPPNGISARKASNNPMAMPARGTNHSGIDSPSSAAAALFSTRASTASPEICGTRSAGTLSVPDK